MTRTYDAMAERWLDDQEPLPKPTSKPKEARTELDDIMAGIGEGFLSKAIPEHLRKGDA